MPLFLHQPKGLDMALVSLKLSDAEKKAARGPEVSVSGSGGPDYNWGLRISLQDEDLKKLGLGGSLPSAGGILVMGAKCKVVGSSSSEYDGKARQTLELQITDMELAPEPSTDLAARIYGSD